MTIPQRRKPNSNGCKRKESILSHLKPDEALTVLDRLLENHPELRSEEEKIAAAQISAPSIDDIAADVFAAVTAVDLETLTDRAGAHSRGYVGPSEAARNCWRKRSKNGPGK